MKKITRLLRKKIRGKDLEELAEVFEVNLKNLTPRTTALKGNYTRITDLYGLLNIIPNKNKIKIEAYFKGGEKVWGPRGATPEFTESVERYAEIPYSDLSKYLIKEK
jgi:hypothetical protein